MCARVQLGTLQPTAAQARTQQWSFGRTYPSANTHAHASSLPNGGRKEVRGLRADDMETEETYTSNAGGRKQQDMGGIRGSWGLKEGAWTRRVKKWLSLIE